MRNGIVYFIFLAISLCVALVVVDVYGAAGFDLDTPPIFVCPGTLSG